MLIQMDRNMKGFLVLTIELAGRMACKAKGDLLLQEGMIEPHEDAEEVIKDCTDYMCSQVIGEDDPDEMVGVSKVEVSDRLALCLVSSLRCMSVACSTDPETLKDEASDLMGFDTNPMPTAEFTGRFYAMLQSCYDLLENGLSDGVRKEWTEQKITQAQGLIEKFDEVLGRCSDDK